MDSKMVKKKKKPKKKQIKQQNYQLKRIIRHFGGDTAQLLNTTVNISDSIRFIKILELPNSASFGAFYNHQFHYISYLDLSDNEYFHLKSFSQIQLVVNGRHVNIDGDILSISRAKPIKNVDRNAVTRNNATKMERIQFSDREPLLAKYKDSVYAVGNQLYIEYGQALSATNYPIGSAIRVREDRVIINARENFITVRPSYASFWHNHQVNVIPSASKTISIYSHYVGEGEDCRFRRYLNHPRHSLVPVDPILEHSSNRDDCDELYAETDFIDPVIRNEFNAFNALNSDNGHNPWNFNEGNLNMMKLPDYDAPALIKDIVWKKEPKTEIIRFREWGWQRTLIKSQMDYVRVMRAMIYLEDETNSFLTSKFDVQAVRFFFEDRMQLYYFDLNEHDQGLSSAIEENRLYSLEMKSITSNKRIRGEIKHKIDGCVYVSCQEFNTGDLYDIHFLSNRGGYKIQLFTVDLIESHHLFSTILHNTEYFEQKVRIKPESTIKLVNKCANLNREQLVAVQNIVEGSSFPLPYIVFGPPGTGKTKTLVAAIEQIVKSTDKNILVCAQSNAACDEITKRLLLVLNENEFYHLYSSSTIIETKSDEMFSVSNLGRVNLQNSYPSLGYLYQFRVLICTLCVSGYLTRACIENVFRPDHFSYVIIDECASASEISALTPVAGQNSLPCRVLCNVVLAGDPMQLGPVVKSVLAKDMGFGVSFIERLMQYPLYSRDPKNGLFNEKYITQLVRNYRSHEAILHIPSKLFYNGTLKAHASSGVKDRFLQSKLLAAPNFPMIFHSVQGHSEQSKDNYSYFNNAEIDVVIQYIRWLLHIHEGPKRCNKMAQSDIGIITPYRQQYRKISQVCKGMGLENILIGSADSFQGQERAVMIMSTVRSGSSLGFVNDPKRMNIMLTRAKSLLIVIGDPFTLEQDENWLELMKYCLENEALIQSQNVFPRRALLD